MVVLQRLDFAVEAFRGEVRDYIRSHLPEATRRMVAEERMDIPKESQRQWHKLLHQRGWSVPAWPEAYGGCGWDDRRLYVFEREIALADAPRPMSNGVQMLGPTLIAFGTAEQKQRFLPPIVSGDVFWCQGYSEPNAGSDLARLSCRAERVGDEYIINGSKLWTTEGHIADWMFGVFRTAHGDKPQFGISFLMVAMDSPGITVQPIKTFDGTHEVNQVFFDNVRVPAGQRMGEEHQGWGVAKYLLSLERFGTAEVSRSMASLARLKTLAAHLQRGPIPLADDSVFAAKIAAADIELQALARTEERFLFDEGADVGVAASLLKICGTQVQQTILTLMMEALGPQALRQVADLDATGGQGGKSGVEEGSVAQRAARHAAKMYFNYRKTSIYSGSNEIMKNIIARHVLGL